MSDPITYAVVKIDTGIVVNRARWNGVSDWSPGDGFAAVPDPDDISEIGGTWSEADGFLPAPTPDPA